ncbi:MAG: VOC family protein [Intrasporangium sp.]|uniref:VOC family protein n=1 Tax=Intrasporangium sp. TaxID=1925024 RepID=UPI002647157D|nr:VOC family protein [Intrasporangium sp.]MDN5794716.1 VOC family protein [Intrasporangium sp.]
MALTTAPQWFGVVLDCPDASELAHYYQQLLGWRLYKDTPQWATLAPDETTGYNLAFQQEPNYVRPVWPSVPGQPLMMLHLDLQVEDLDAAVARAVGLGAQLAAHQPQEEVRVMLDPAGHPFCFYIDDDDATDDT